MARREVLRMGNPVLRQHASDFTPEEIKSEETKKLIEDMIETMEAEDGIGLAAPQIGILKKLALVGIPKEDDDYELLIVFNPIIKVLDETTEECWEGCLSVPGLRGLVERPQKIEVEYLDEQANPQKVIAEGFAATVFQHEVDHLFGTLYIDKIKDTKNLSFTEEFLKFQAGDED
ncbi:MAG: peptide deformylase [Bacteriovoracaceae bacterium]